MVLPSLSLKFPVRTLLVAAALAALAAGGWLLGPGLVCVAHQDEHLVHTGQLMAEASVGQVFHCDRANLSRIETRMGTYGSWSDSRFEFGLVELERMPEGERARFGPKDGALIRLREGWALTTLLEAARPGADGLELLVSRPGNADEGELVVAVVPWELGHLDLTLPLIFRRPLKELGAHHPVRFSIPRKFLDPSRPLMVAVRVEGTRPGSFLGLHWLPFPAAHLPQIMDRPNRFWQAVLMEYLGPDEDRETTVFPGWLIARLTYPPTVPLKPLKRSSVENAAWVSDNAYYPVSFKPLPDSENKSYHFFWRAPAASLSDALTMWAHRRAGPGSFLTDNGTPVDGALCFRAFAAVSKNEAMNLFTARLDEGKTGCWLSGWTMIAAVLVQILVVASVLLFLIGRRSLGDD